MRILHLTLKKKWFNMIASGEKKEEYRELKPYWQKRLQGKEFDVIQFKNGYGKNSPKITVKLRSIIQGHGRPEWGSGYEECYILRLGEIIELHNHEKTPPR